MTVFVMLKLHSGNTRALSLRVTKESNFGNLSGGTRHLVKIPTKIQSASIKCSKNVTIHEHTGFSFL